MWDEVFPLSERNPDILAGMSAVSLKRGNVKVSAGFLIPLYKVIRGSGKVGGLSEASFPKPGIFLCQL